MLSKGMDQALNIAANVGPILIGLAGPSAVAGAGVHALSGFDPVSRRMHMASQIQGGYNLAKELAKYDPTIMDDYRAITRAVSAAERKQMGVLDNMDYLHFMQDFSAVPPEWTDALQKFYDDRTFDAPTGTVAGRTFQEFFDRVTALREQARDRLNAAREVHGEETIGKLKPIHPSSYSSWGTSNLFTQPFGEAVTGVKNTAVAINGAKGFDQPEKIKAQIRDGLEHHAKYSPDGFYIELDDAHYLTNGKSKVRIEGGKAYLVDEDGNPVKSGYALDEWTEKESDRFTDNIEEFRNVSDKKGVTGPQSYRQEFPFMPVAHESTIQDWLGDILSMDMEAAALEAHPADLVQRIEALKDKVTGKGYGKVASKMTQYLGGMDTKNSASLAGRAMQQRGRLSMGDANALNRIAQAWMPFGYKMGLVINPTPAAAQQAQAAAQTIAFTGGDKTWPVRAGKQYAKAAGREIVNTITPGARSGLRIGHTKHLDPGRMNAMESGTALIANAIEGDVERIMGNALENGNPEWLENVYTPDELARLKYLRRDDGTVDLSDPADKELAQSVMARYLEGHNGLDLPTSKPALLQSNTGKTLGMFMGTPMVVTKAVSDLYRPGGLFHTGTKKDIINKGIVTTALAGQLVGANAVRSSAVAKALALLSAGGVLPASMVGLGAISGYESPAEQTAAQQLEQLTAAGRRLAMLDGDPDELAKDFVNASAVMFTGSVPLKVTGPSDLLQQMTGSIDRKAFNAGPARMPDKSGAGKFAESVGMFYPGLGAAINAGISIADAATAQNESVYGWKSWLMRDISALPIVRQYSPIFPETRQKVKTGESGARYTGTETYKNK